MTFAWPYLLWLLVVPATLLVWDIVRGRRSAASTFPKILRAEAGMRQLEFSARGAAAFGRVRPRLLLALGLALGVAALARPQWGRTEEQVFDRSREILIAVDLSRSMLVTDVLPSRLERTKLLIQALLQRLEGERVGLMLFAGTAFVQSPLSADYEILLEFLPEIGPKYLPAGGSEYGKMLDAALGSFSNTSAADRFLVVLSDGEATDEDWRTRVDELKAKGIRFIGLGVGTAEGGLVPDGSGGFVKDERGAVVLSKLEPLTLQELARETSGTYRDAAGWVDIPALIQETVATGRQGAFIEEVQVRKIERFQWALAPALFILLLSFWREFPIRPRPRDLRLVQAAGDAAIHGAAAAALILLGALALPKLGAAEPDPAAMETAAAPVSKVVSRLAGQAAQSAADWAELARTTITYGGQIRDMEQPIPEGPLRDALAAVTAGAALDANAADWARMRRELEELLKKSDAEPPPPEEQQPPPQQDKQGEQTSPENKDGEKSDESEQSKDKSESKGGDDQEQKKSDSDEKSKADEKKDSEDAKPQDDAFGDMDEPQEDPDMDQQPPDESQKVGGTPHSFSAAREADPSLAMPLQRLDQLREQDSPAELFLRMDRAENPNQPRTGKDW